MRVKPARRRTHQSRGPRAPPINGEFTMSRNAFVLALALFASANLHAAGTNIDKVNGAISAEAGTTYGTLSTVNGSIRIEDGVSADSAETVNGSITVGDNAQVGGLETVNGGVRLGSQVSVGEGVETVNGSVTLNRGSRVGGTVETVNGAIRLDQAEVGRIETVNGDIDVGADSVVHNGILVEKTHGWNLFGRSRVPRVTIGANARVDGELVFKREVELLVHPSATIGKVIGATAKPYGGEQLPER